MARICFLYNIGKRFIAQIHCVWFHPTTLDPIEKHWDEAWIEPWPLSSAINCSLSTTHWLPDSLIYLLSVTCELFGARSYFELFRLVGNQPFLYKVLCLLKQPFLNPRTPSARLSKHYFAHMFNIQIPQQVLFNGGFM